MKDVYVLLFFISIFNFVEIILEAQAYANKCSSESPGRHPGALKR